MNFLEKRIIKDGKVIGEDILKVDSFQKTNSSQNKMQSNRYKKTAIRLTKGSFSRIIIKQL